MLGELGADVINCDKIAHNIYLKGKPCHTKLVEAFGERILDNDGEVNRKELGAIVFSSLVSFIGLLYCKTVIVWVLGRVRQAEFFGLARDVGGSQQCCGEVELPSRHCRSGHFAESRMGEVLP